MSIISPESKLADVILMNEPSIVTIINRFGIPLGVGDLSIAGICERHGLDKVFFTTILNTYINPDYFPEKVLSSFRAQTIIDFLATTNAYYEHILIPNVERHFTLLVNRASSQNSKVALMLQFFTEVKHEIMSRIANDRQSLFPAIIQNKRIATPLESILAHDAGMEDKINDLINMFVVHFNEDYDQNLGVAVYITLRNLKKDISNDNRIRNRILLPLYLKNNP